VAHALPAHQSGTLNKFESFYEPSEGEEGGHGVCDRLMKPKFLKDGYDHNNIGRLRKLF
jgi:hypothetical protein